MAGVLLLDTHVWLWSADGDTRRVGRRARQALLKAESRDDIRISPVTIFEVTALHTLGRLRLARSLDQSVPRLYWIRQAFASRS